MKIAIIGSGFFGLTLGLFLSKKHNVVIYEKENQILSGASAANQFRFHYGYHYPRSQKTVSEIKKSKNLFIDFFKNEKIFQKTLNYYSIAKNSKIKYKKYIKFLKKNKLYYKKVNNLENTELIDKTILSEEKILNYFNFKKLMKKKIKESNLKIIFNQKFKKGFLRNYEKVILASYSNNNKILNELGIIDVINYKFELVEKIVIKLPKKYLRQSYVVIDGRFVCVDPYLGTNYHLLSDVKYSKLETITGKFPKFIHKNKKYLNKGIIKNINISKFNKFIERSSLYLPFLKSAKYVGSMFVVRVIKKNKENTDERTSSITRHSSKILSILSGKWNNCVYLSKNFKL